MREQLQFSGSARCGQWHVPWLFRWLVLWPVLACSGLACDRDSGDSWVEDLPPHASGVEALNAQDTWLDLLDHSTRSVNAATELTVELVDFSSPPEKESGLEEMQRGREGALSVISDQRRAWLVPLAESVTFELPIERGGRLRTAFGLVTSSDQPLPDGVSVSFGIEFRPGGKTRSIARAKLYAAQQNQWHEVLGEVSGPGVLRFSASVTGASSAPVLKVAFATPTLELESSRVPDVIIVSVDTLRADRLGCYGYGRETSPHIDRLASRGVVFENCLSQAPWTLPSYGSLFTSLYPAEHRAGISEKAEIWTRGGVASDFEKLGQKLVEDVPTLAEELARAGYRTASFYFNPYLSPRTGIARGFDEHVFLRYSANAGVDRAIAWLKLNAGLPRFLFLQLIDPHWPYAPPAPFDTRFAGRSVDQIENYPWALPSIRNQKPSEKKQTLLSDLYDGEIAYTDAELGRLFDYLERPGTLDQRLLIFQSDHGEEFWDHGQFEHGHSMHQELLRVPLIISMPTLLAPARVSASVRTIDIFPTVMGLLGLTPPNGLRGSSLVPIARAELEHVQLTGFAESILWGRPYAPFDEAKSLVTDGLKIIIGDGDAPPQLYSLSDDPTEQNNLASSRPQDVERLKQQLQCLYESARGNTPAETLKFDEQQQHRLENLGY